MPTKTEAIDRLNEALEPIPELMTLNADAPDFAKWRRGTEIMIINTFPEGSRHREEFSRIMFTAGYISFNAARDAAAAAEAYHSGFIRAQTLLESIIDEVQRYWPDGSTVQPIAQSQAISEPPVSNRVFVVHGRDLGVKDTVARFLESLELNPVVLQEQANEGRTIIEKFEDFSDVGYAVVLCTPDDVGALASEQENLRPRPRQNVVLEWGFFFGRLGRNRVCALLKEDVEIPSDYAGVVYIKLDELGAWQMELAREMRRAGLPVDLNRLA